MQASTTLARVLFVGWLAASVWSTGCQQAGTSSGTSSSAPSTTTQASTPGNAATAIPIVNKAQQVAGAASGSVTQGLAVVHFGASW